MVNTLYKVINNKSQLTATALKNLMPKGFNF